MTKTLLLSITDHIATIAFNRPDAMNSFNKQMGDELLQLTEQIRMDESVRAVLLKGTGPLFMAGGDIRFFQEKLDIMPEGVMDIVRALNGSILNLMHMPKPVLASVHGSVAGVGVSLMMACDLVIAANNTKFTMAYSGLGVSPDGGAAYNLPRLVGAKKAMEWLLLSELFDANTAIAYGLINWSVAPETLDTETMKLLTRLASGPTQAFAHTKRLINESTQLNLENHLEREGSAFAHCTTTADFRAGVTGFLNKKRPVFQGK